MTGWVGIVHVFWAACATFSSGQKHSTAMSSKEASGNAFMARLGMRLRLRSQKI
jgi:hypothetical protein